MQICNMLYSTSNNNAIYYAILRINLNHKPYELTCYITTYITDDQYAINGAIYSFKYVPVYHHIYHVN